MTTVEIDMDKFTTDQKHDQYRKMSFRDLVNEKPGTIAIDSIYNDVRYIVVVGPLSLCAYIAIPQDNPNYGVDYNQIDFRCHWGLTYSAMGSGNALPTGQYWIGWDYAHLYDCPFFDVRDGRINWNNTQWTVDMVEHEVHEAIEENEYVLKCKVKND